jgi:hypothetical protein
MIEDMTVRNFAPGTKDIYVGQVSLFARHFGKSPEQLVRATIKRQHLR